MSLKVRTARKLKWGQNTTFLFKISGKNGGLAVFCHNREFTKRNNHQTTTPPLSLPGYLV